ncbi:MAG TPA: L,D-transpeptidase family protein [Pyrinomonadaceae bacterium]|nr:L,D-transpeptidase family protein [Pyrinomonadaceae bacterium]
MLRNKTTPNIRTGLILPVAITIFIFGIADYGSSRANAHRPRAAAQELSTQEKLEAEQRLWSLGYWAGPVDGKFDSDSRHALIAFQKVERRARTGKLTLDELNALRAATRPQPRYTRYPHVEIDLKRQVLFVVDESGEVMRVLPVSTGNGELYMDHGQIHRARTPTGTFKVLRKIKGWRLSSLGLMYYPNYIFNGIAIHGSFSIPTRPASHGCIRVPMFAAKELSSLLPIGIEVVIYNGSHQRKELQTVTLSSGK